MPLLIPDRKNRRSRGATSGRRRGGDIGSGIWRLLACTEGSRDTAGEEEEEEEDGGDAWATRHRTAIGRQERRHPRKKKATEQRRSGRRRQQGSGASADDATAVSSYGGSSADHRRRPTRSSDRRDHGLRLRRPRPPIGAGDVAGSQRRRRTSAGALAASSSAVGEPRRTPGSPRHGGGRRRRKRLVVAMLEDGDDDDGATPRRNQGPEHRASTVKLRTTRNERSIRRILQELSVTLDAADSRVLPEFATVEIPSSSAQRSPQKSPAVAATSNTMTMQPSPAVALRMSSPPPPPPLRSMAHPLPPPPSLQLPTHPPPHAVPSASRAHAEPDIINMAQQQQQQQHQQSNQQLQQDLLEQVQKADYAVSQCAGPTMEETAVRGNGRRGYRLFRRVFSASDNYYAVPFPPLETIKLNDDDDQWEDLEIYVASHKGMVAIKPKAGKQQQKKQSEASSLRRPSNEKLLTFTSAIPRPIANPARKEPLRPPKKSAPMAPSIGAVAGGDQLAKRASLQQQLSKPPPPSSTARAGPLEPSTRLFGYRQQQHQQTQQQQMRQRRADPLSPSRLLSQLRQAEPAGRPTMLTPPPSMGNARASQLPRCRWEPSAPAGGNPATTASGGSRYGKLSAKLPPGAGLQQR